MQKVEKNTRPSYLVVLNNKGKSEFKFFVTIVIRRDEFSNPAYFHGIGYFSNEKPKIENIGSDKEIVEVWVPWGEIKYVESLVYRYK